MTCAYLQEKVKFELKKVTFIFYLGQNELQGHCGPKFQEQFKF